MYSPSSPGQTPTLTPVSVHTRVIPDGVADGKARFAVMLTPDPVIQGGATNLTLECWVKDVIDFVKAGFETRTKAGEAKTKRWSLPLAISQDLALTSGRPPRIVLAEAVALKEAFAGRDARSEANRIWHDTITARGGTFKELASGLNAALSGTAVTPGKINETDGVPEASVTEQEARNLLGDQGQHKAKPGIEECALDAIIKIPYADLALSLDAQRAAQFLSGAAAAAPVRPYVPARRAEDDETIDEGGALKDYRIRKYTRTVKAKAVQDQRRTSKAAYDDAMACAAAGRAHVTKPTKDATVFSLAGQAAAGSCFESASTVYDYATWPQHRDRAQTSAEADEAGKMLPTDTSKEAASRAFFALQSTPGLDRLVCLCIDVEVEIAALELTEGSPFIVSCPLAEHLPLLTPTNPRPRNWTLARLRPGGEAPFNGPITLAECQGVESGHRDGYLLMSQFWGEAAASTRFDITSRDIRTVTEMELQRRQNAEAGSLPRDAAWAGHTAGLVLMHRSIATDAAARLASRIAKGTPGGRAVPNCGCAVTANGVVLDADDLRIGYRLEAGLLTAGSPEPVWRPLTNRKVRWGTSDGDGRSAERLIAALLGKQGSEARLAREAAYITTPSRLIPLPGGTAEAVFEEAVSQWDGSPMGVECAKGPDSSTSVEDILPFGRTLSLPDDADPREHRPMELRYGMPLTLRMTTAYGGGVSRTPGGTAPHPHVPYPPKDGNGAGKQLFQRFLRQHPLKAPQVLLPKGHALSARGHMGFENATELVVRSLPKSADQELRRHRATPAIAQRILVVPSIEMDEAARHGCFDDAGVRGAFARNRLTADCEGFPVTRTTSQSGIDGVRHIASREIVYAPKAEATNELNRSTSLEHGILERSAAPGNTKYYPDPAADVMVLAVRRLDNGEHLDGRIEIRLQDAGASSAWPDIPPVVVTVMRRTGTRAAPASCIHDLLAVPETDYRPGSFDPNLGGDIRDGDRQRGFMVDLALFEGEEFTLDAWMLPSVERLYKEFAFPESFSIWINSALDPFSRKIPVNGLKADLRAAFPQHAKKIDRIGEGEQRFVAPGGIIGPPLPALKVVAEILQDEIKQRPFHMLCAVRSLTLVHATGMPAHAPSFVPSGCDASRKISDADILRPSKAAMDAALECYLERTGQRVCAAASHCPDDPVTAADLGLDRRIMRGATHYVLDAAVRVDLAETDALEIVAKVALPSSSVFDNPRDGRSLLKRRAGTWPSTESIAGQAASARPISARDVFGFWVEGRGRKVAHTRSEVVLLQIDGLTCPPKGDTVRDVSLLPFFLAALHQDKKAIALPFGGRLKALHEFPDTLARIMEVDIRARGRTAARLATVARIAPDGEFKPSEPLPRELQHRKGEGGPVTLALPATRRPSRCAARIPEPAFSWRETTETGCVTVERRAVVRLLFERGWFSSGEDEQVGIVLWPPDLTINPAKDLGNNQVTLNDGRKIDIAGLVDGDLGEGGRFVTRMGGDPIRAGPGDIRLFLSQDDFPDLERDPSDPRYAVYRKNVLMPLAEDEESKTGNGAIPREAPATMLVGLVCYRPRFDVDRERWFVDVELSAANATDPFVRLGLVRFQPHGDEALAVSPPVVQWTQLMPHRRAVAALEPDGRHVTLTVSGQASQGAKKVPWRPLSTPYDTAQQPLMRVRLFTEIAGAFGRMERHRVALGDSADGVSELFPANNNGHAIWTCRIPVSSLRELSATDRHIVYLEEVERRRPASYAEEPLEAKHFAPEYEGIGEPEGADPFIDSGARFAVRLDLASVLPTSGGAANVTQTDDAIAK